MADTAPAQSPAITTPDRLNRRVSSLMTKESELAYPPLLINPSRSGGGSPSESPKPGGSTRNDGYPCLAKESAQKTAVSPAAARVGLKEFKNSTPTRLRSTRFVADPRLWS